MRSALRRLASGAAAAAAATGEGCSTSSAVAAAAEAAVQQRVPRWLLWQQQHLQQLQCGLSSYTGAGPSGAPRHVTQRPPPPAEAGDAPSSAAAAAASVSSPAAGAARPAGPMFAEMNREVPGGTKPMHSWERWYWGAGVGAVSLWLFWRLKPEGKTPEQIEEEKRKAADLEVSRRDHLRGVLAGQRGGGFISEGDDPLDGLSPQQIEALMEQAGIDPRDPLEGMTPEEIDEYVRRQEQLEEQRQQRQQQGAQQDQEQEQEQEAGQEGERPGGGGGSGGGGAE